MAISTTAFGTFVYASIRKNIGKLGIKWNGQAPNLSVVRSDISIFKLSFQFLQMRKVYTLLS